MAVSVTGGSAFLPVESLVANKAGGASLCQRRQPPKAGAEGQRLQRLVPPATIGPALGGLTTLWIMPTIADDAELRTQVAGGNKPPLNTEEPSFIISVSSLGLVVGQLSCVWLVLASLALFEPITVAIHFEDLDVVGQSVEQRTGQPLGPEHAGPLVERQIAGDDGGASFVALAEDLKQQLGAGRRQGYMPSSSMINSL